MIAMDGNTVDVIGLALMFGLIAFLWWLLFWMSGR